MIEEKVKLKDIKPYGSNPREDFGDVKALAESFSINSMRPGEPFNPIVVVKDGKIYRIIDGERRYKAMVLAKTKDCTVILADNLDEANAIVTMMATDDKKILSDKEKSKGVQQMLMLGVEPEVAAKSARLDVKQLKSAKKALTTIKPKKPETLSIRHLAALNDFPLLINALENAIIDSGLERDDGAKGYPKYETVEYRLETAAEFKKAVAKLTDKTDLVVKLYKGDPEYSYDKPSATIYKKLATSKSGKPVKSKKEVLTVRLQSQNKRAAKLRAQWIADHIATWEKDLKHVGAFCLKHLDYYSVRNMECFDEKYGCKTPITINAVMISATWGGEGWDSLRLGCACGATTDRWSGGGPESYERHIDMMAAMVKDGYQVSEEEQELLDLLIAHIAKQETKEGDGSVNQ